MSKSRAKNIRIRRGTTSALFSAALLGFTPIFGKLALSGGLSPYLVVTFRTILATFFIAITIFLVNRKSFYIYPAGLIGCTIAGIFNGIGSLFYYHSLSLINANVGQLIYMTYPMFVVMWIWLDGQRPSVLSLLRLFIILVALGLLIFGTKSPMDIKGLLFMLVAGALYAIHLPINQRVLYEMPAPTVTFYTLLSMTVVVTLFSVFQAGTGLSTINQGILFSSKTFLAIIALAVVTFLSRVTLFLGVKKIGGVQTALLGVTELITAIFFSNLILGETLAPVQWIGVIMIIASICLNVFDHTPQHNLNPRGWLHWIVPDTSRSKINPTYFD